MNGLRRRPSASFSGLPDRTSTRRWLWRSVTSGTQESSGASPRTCARRPFRRAAPSAWPPAPPPRPPRPPPRPLLLDAVLLCCRCSRRLHEVRDVPPFGEGEPHQGKQDVGSAEAKTHLSDG